MKTPPALPATAAPTLPAAPFTALTVSGVRSTSLSLPSALPATVVSSDVVAVSATATGASFAALTLPLTAPVAVAPDASATV